MRARNSVGYSSYSTPFTILAAIIPDEPINFERDEGLTSKTQVAFTWSAPSDNGGSAVIDYAIEWTPITQAPTLRSRQVLHQLLTQRQV